MKLSPQKANPLDFYLFSTEWNSSLLERFFSVDACAYRIHCNSPNWYLKDSLKQRTTEVQNQASKLQLSARETRAYVKIETENRNSLYSKKRN
jgi:hypothetical protein